MSTRPTWVEISLPQLAENFRIIREHVGPGRAVMAIVKADAYGHGLPQIASKLSHLGADWFGVTSADEGIELRHLGITQPVLLLTGFWHGEQNALTDYDLVPAVYSEDQLVALESWGQHTGKRIPFHLKVNTGMGRLGVHWQEIDSFVRTYARMRHVELEGLFTQFASAEDFTTHSTEEQAARFCAVEQAITSAGVQPRYLHQANSAAIVSRPETWGNMVRPGGLLYGCPPAVRAAEGSLDRCRALSVKGILTFKTRVISVKEVAGGIALGYGGRYVTPRPSRIAVIPAGYADGLDRRLSNRGRVIVDGRYAPIVGNISMDLTLVDVTEMDRCAVGDEVILIGGAGERSVSVVDLADMAGTISYEILCGINKRVPRRYLP
jgi:alanine racemase